MRLHVPNASIRALFASLPASAPSPPADSAPISSSTTSTTKKVLNANSGDEIADLQAKDLKKIPDCLVVMGTSLKIVGVKRLIKDFASLIQAGSGGSIVFINKTAPPKELHSCFDTYIERDCDSAVNVIMQTWKEIDSAKLVKKEELAARQRARAAKLAREKAATTPITNMLKVVKKESSVTTSKLEKNVNVVIGSGKKASDTFVNQNSIESKQPAKDVKAQKENMAPLKASRLSKSLKAGTASVRAVGIVAAST